MTVVEATEASIEAAADDLTPRDRGAVRALLKLAEQIDAGKTDNVLLPTYLKFCEALHLTPASREKLPKQEAKPVGKVDELKAKRAKRSA